MNNDDLVYDDMLESTIGGVEDALGAVTAAAVELIEGVDHADVLLIEDGEFRSVTPTSPVIVRLDTAQRELQEGPCLAAALSEAVVRSPNLGNDARWPRFGPVAVDAGVHRILSFQLYTHRRGAGALNLLSATTGTFDLEAEAIGAMLATHAATVLIAANRKRQFESALASRDVIGQAKGIIMERFHVDAVRAFELLTSLSRDSNTPLPMIAQELVARIMKDHPSRDEVIRGTRC
ncbi:GAF and ANTAR domain-containing protein [Mycobacterium intracellulare]|uniref:GAF and ANTAR domain-containing protein n=1 Tax=Mycobacterium intracellulare TaxID=1767 RepID=A0AAE4UBA9_MYCIT|nr:GAF and ANTAR domain-containing protein [Mycobacterium intracellulare]MDV6979291.1 GAF and ANTAR domain-containing protein [Mycobacterium intracellulare]MDV6984742.1 GAF and ANTAR domain-containing protein [Mycobacterium intracellulare]MDV7014846.1 GAF and ANTAR domain-containing protein [Mycobacterium intracellulare]MDV7031017.1 GAF and ANTAR domain-containing protein [Mycobacterium intracellulare]